MNSEEPALDLCNAKNSSGESTAANPSGDEIIPRNSDLLMDGEAVKQVVDLPTLARLSACPVGENDEPERTKDKSDSVEVNVNKNNGIAVSAAAVGSDPSDCSDDNKHRNSSDMVPEAPVIGLSIGVGVDVGDMDIGVDLSLDETGILEPEPPVPKSESASGGTGVNLEAQLDTSEASEKSAEMGQGDASVSLSQAETLSSPTSDLGEEQTLKPGAKRVTFPSDEDIVSGAVEPKDPWRHGNSFIPSSLFCQTSTHTHTLMSRLP